MMPDITIPYSIRRDANEARYGNGGERCLLCCKPIKDAAKAHVIILDEGLGSIADPMTPAGRNGGEFLIGPDCWRRNPQVHSYEIRADRPSYRDP